MYTPLNQFPFPGQDIMHKKIQKKNWLAVQCTKPPLTVRAKQNK